MNTSKCLEAVTRRRRYRMHLHFIAGTWKPEACAALAGRMLSMSWWVSSKSPRRQKEQRAVETNYETCNQGVGWPLLAQSAAAGR